MELPRAKPLKTYGNPRKRAQNLPPKLNEAVPAASLPMKSLLTTKKAVELLIGGKLKFEVCRFCLDVGSPLSELDQILSVGGRGAIYDVTIRDMVAAVHPFKVMGDPNFPNKICNICLNKAIRSYLFAQQCEQSERALRNCFDDMFEKLEKLDPLQRTMKRGRQKLNPNHNTLYAEHKIVMDYAEPIRCLINTGSVSLTNESPMGHLECKKCWQVLPNMESLVHHEKTHPKTMWYNCRLCGKSFAKRNQLKKHLKYTHETNVALPENDKFECKKCGCIRDNHISHLQHIEKHKFQMVVEHLVEKKMDELCVVCYEKDNKLVELDKVIALHGGYPELTGERSLFNILGTTLPENKSFKYQELFVPRKANIITITKRLKASLPPFDNQNQAQITTQTSFMVKQHFDISHPVVISKDNIDCHNLCLFTFSEPIKLGDKSNIEINFKTSVEYDSPNIAEAFDEIKDDKVDDSSKMNFTTPAEQKSSNVIDVDLNNYGYDVSVQNASTDVVEENTIFNFVDPDVKDIVKTGKQKVEVNECKEFLMNETLCKVCWIFNKPNCKKCIGTMKPNQEEIATKVLMETDGKALIKKDDTSETCNFCWLFKKTVRCDYCKKTFNGEETSNVDSKISAVSPIKKRKIFDEVIEVKAKKLKWQCQVCLTSNSADRETCICCDSGISNENIIKHNFGNNTYFNIAHKSKNIEPKPSTLKTSVDDLITFAENDNHVNLNVIDSGFKVTQHKIVLFEQIHKMGTYNVENMDTEIITSKESPKTTAQTNVFNDKPKQHQKMDVDEVIKNDKSNISLPSNPTSPNFFPNTTFNQIPSPKPSTIDFKIPNVQPTSFRFNVGSGPVEPKGRDMRKYMRPLRRNATGFHKS